jgi:hypothetical protein
VLDSALQALQYAEQRERDADLEKDEDRAPGLAPDARPDERQVLDDGGSCPCGYLGLKVMRAASPVTFRYF